MSAASPKKETSRWFEDQREVSLCPMPTPVLS